MVWRVCSIYNLTSHNYNVRQNSLTSNENSNPETSKLIINLESKLSLRFDNLDKKNAQFEGCDYKRSIG